MENMSPWLLLVISVFAGQVATICRSYYCKLLATDTRSYYLLNGAVSAVCAVLLWLVGGAGVPAISTFTLWLGVVFGLVTMIQGLASAAALSCGPISYTTVITALATIITALAGAIFWHERISLLQVLGMLLLIGCFICSVDTKRSNGQSANLRWLVLCLIAFACCGGVGIMQKVHQTSAYKLELSGFLIVAFLVSAVCSLVMYAVYPLFAHKAIIGRSASPQKRASLDLRKLGLVAVLFLAIGAGTAAINQLNLYLSGVLPAAVFFPIVNGGALVLTTLFSVLFFKERLSLRQWIGLGMGAASVLLLCL